MVFSLSGYICLDSEVIQNIALERQNGAEKSAGINSRMRALSAGSTMHPEG
jgi:hypothetical protein